MFSNVMEMCVCVSVTVCLTCVLSVVVHRCVVPVMKLMLQPARRPESHWDPGGSSWTVVRCWTINTVTLHPNIDFLILENI